jgi:hypothetical protein
MKVASTTIQGIDIFSYLEEDSLNKEFHSLCYGVLSFLKQRGVVGISKVVEKILLRKYDPSIDYLQDLGVYYPKYKMIHLIVQESKTRKTLSFENDKDLYFNTLVHEIGHALEERLHPEALQYWETPWREYTFEYFKNSESFIKSVIYRLFETKGQISKFQYQNFNDYLKVFILFAVFLKEYSLTSDLLFNHLDKRKPFNWELPLIDSLSFFKDPSNKDVLFSEYPEDFLSIFSKPILENKKITRYVKQLDFVEDLNLPSIQHYNPREDFAESFRIWVLTPMKIKGRQKERLIHTLWLSGFYGKKIVRRNQLDG